MPTWQTLPAVQASQIVAWTQAENWSYQRSAEEIELLTDGVKRANPDIVSSRRTAVPSVVHAGDHEGSAAWLRSQRATCRTYWPYCSSASGMAAATLPWSTSR